MYILATVLERVDNDLLWYIPVSERRSNSYSCHDIL